VQKLFVNREKFMHREKNSLRRCGGGIFFLGLHKLCLVFSTASPNHTVYVCEECLAVAPAFGPQTCSSYPQIQEAIAVTRLYDLVSSDVLFGNSLLKFKLVILVFKKMILQQVIFTIYHATAGTQGGAFTLKIPQLYGEKWLQEVLH
jgi:hypothetical protein